MNLSDVVLDEQQLSVLKKGLGFVPMAFPDFTEMHIDLFKFTRKCKLMKYFDHKYHFDGNYTDNTATCDFSIGDIRDIQTLLSLEGDDNSRRTPTCDDILMDLGFSSSTTCASGLRPRSRFTPIFSSDNAIDVFHKLVTNDLYKLENQYSFGRKSWSRNLSPQELKALRSLDDIRDVVIKEADKGGNIVIMNRKDYVGEIDRQLQDQKAYCKLYTNPIGKITRDLETTLSFWKDRGLLTNSECKYLFNPTPMFPCICILPKVHKSAPFPPGRPIISGINSPTEKLSEYIDLFLQPFVRNLPSYIKDTTHLVSLIADYEWTEGNFLATLDVTSLYTCIPKKEGMAAIRHFLDKREAMFLEHSNMLMDLINLVMDNNIFLHEGSWYRQQQGVAIGAKFSPSFAKLYMGHFEHHHLWTKGPQELTQHILYWGRYIDDVLLFWSGDHMSLDRFIQYLNVNSYNINFTSSISSVSVDFLDVTLYTEGNHICSKLFRKATASNSISSAHPHAQIKAIPFGEAVRVRRNCQEDLEFSKQLDLLEHRFLNKGYSKKLLSNTRDRILKIDRSSLFHKTNTETDAPKKGPSIYNHLHVCQFKSI
ncbi:hypothetical protein NDU88_008218 [Pleurodeles waltl]|uniref:Helix-turn-helix domain-containing protein n=1 Tax=Pleurodeles waltl TaxID=8319 RepID=A0AAV7RX08_PLEWA|nr:hypothetical protein NDU88_008218 [Pleurodeles waltl]